MRVGVVPPASVVAMSRCGDETGGERGPAGAGGCRGMPNVASGRTQHLAIVLRLGTSHTRTIYGARASAWRHNLNGKEGGCRGCSHPAQRGVGWGEPRRAPAPTGRQRMLWLDACPRHTPGHSHQRGTERWAMAEGADRRGGGNRRTTARSPSFPDRERPLFPRPSPRHIRSLLRARRRGQRQPRHRV